MNTGPILSLLKTKRSKKIFKILLYILIIPVLLIALISPISKYLIEKYDVTYTGREITLDRPYVNLFTGYISFSNIKISEAYTDSLFLKAEGISANISLYKLLSRIIEISELTLDEPTGTLIQNKKDININDLIARFKKKPNADPNKAPLKFIILNFKINNGEIHYKEVNTPVHISIHKLFMEGSGIRWNSDTIRSTYSFVSGVGKGKMNGYFRINTKNFNYNIESNIDSLDLNFINQYIKDLANYGEFKGVLDAKLHTVGNFRDAQVLSAAGNVCLSEFHLEDHKGGDCIRFKRLAIGVTQLSPNNHKYIFDSIIMADPYLKYEQYDHQNNIQTMFYKKNKGGYVSKNPERFNLVVEIGNYLKVISKNFFKSNYQVNRLAISHGKLQYNNFSLNEKFAIAADPLFLSADSIIKTRKMVELQFKTLIKPYGNVSVSLNINPKDSSDFDLVYYLKDLPLAMFNPYLISYTSFPVDRGTVELQGKWNVKNGYIKSTNHLLVIDPRISKRIRRKNARWLPLKLVMALVRERGNVIDYEIPITGNMKHPDFNFSDVIWDVVKNVFVKPPTTPYEYTVKDAENSVERSHSLKWTMGQFALESDQSSFLKNLADYLQETPDAHLTISPIEHSEKEKENILFFEAKKKYYLSRQVPKTKSFDEDDSLTVDKMNIRDSLFIERITRYCHNSMLFTIQEKCYCYVGEAVVKKKLLHLREQREKEFRYYFKENNTNKRVLFHSTENKIPYNGFSFFRIEYDKGLPVELSEAYQKLIKLNNESPRKKYRSLRRKNENRSK